jgi:GPH family glycoside/pentoside/hexuronide:cation symporter
VNSSETLVETKKVSAPEPVKFKEILGSIYADASDFNQWKAGRPATAMTAAAATFSQKLGGALGSAGILWVLAAMGFAANQVQEDASVTSIIWLQTVVPAFFAFIAIFALRYYDLSADMPEKIQQNLDEVHRGDR